MAIPAHDFSKRRETILPLPEGEGRGEGKNTKLQRGDIINYTALKANGVYCMNNTRQMALAWIMHVDDNAGRPAPNVDGILAGTSASTSCRVAGYLTFDTSMDNTNTAGSTLI